MSLPKVHKSCAERDYLCSGTGIVRDKSCLHGITTRNIIKQREKTATTKNTHIDTHMDISKSVYVLAN